MNYIDFSDISLKINDESIYCNNVRLSTSIDISAAFEEGGKVPTNYLAKGPHEGSLSFAYYLTGRDFIYDYAYKSSDPISVNLGGLVINSGYLTSYSFQAQAYSFVKINASLKFFEKVKGRISKTETAIKPNKLSTISNIVINDTTTILENDLIRFGYTYNSTVVPQYEVQNNFEDMTAKRVGETNKTIKSSFTTYDYDLNIDLSLPIHKAKYSFEGGQHYKVSGPIIAESSVVDVNNAYLKEYQISQGVLDFTPKIDGFYPAQGTAGSSFTVSGDNLIDAISVHLHEFLGNITDTYTHEDKDHLIVEVPKDPFVGHQGPIIASTYGGKALSSGVFKVT